MKIITEEKTIPAKTYTETKYIASDGREFFNEKSCLDHEQYLEIMSHPVYTTRVTTTTLYDDDFAMLYYFSSEEDYEFFIATGAGSYKDSDFEKYGAGWYLVCDIDHGHHIYTHILNYDNYVKEYEIEFEKWKRSNAEKMQHIN
jgi:hypothetical protein